jgi:hypothetical protein
VRKTTRRVSFGVMQAREPEKAARRESVGGPEAKGKGRNVLMMMQEMSRSSRFQPLNQVRQALMKTAPNVVWEC